MGLFSGIKRQLLKVIEWKDESKDTIVYRYFNIDNYRVNVFELFVCLSIF